MFLKKIKLIYLVLSLIEISLITCQLTDEITQEEIGSTYIETPNFSNLNPMSSDMSDPIIKELTKHYADLLNRKGSQIDVDDVTEEQENKSEEINSKDDESKQISTTETATVLSQQPSKLELPVQLDELNETDDIETSRKFFITTLLPELITKRAEQQNPSSTTEIIDKIEYINSISSPAFSSSSNTNETNNQTIFDETNESENETDFAGENEKTNDEGNETNFHLTDDTENNDDENDSRSISSALYISAEINDTSEIANEMKHNILYTDEIDENNLLRVYNHSSNDMNDNLMGEIQPNKVQEEERKKSDERKPNFSYEPSSIVSRSDFAAANETEKSEMEIADMPEMLIATTTTIPSIIQSIQRSKQGKQIIHHPLIEEKILLPHEKLRNFIEDPYSRSPIAAIIDPSENVLERARALWKNALRPNTGLDIILLALVNRTALPLIYHLDNTRTFLAGLNSMKESTNADPFSGVLKATELIPYDSAVFICVESVEPNPELANFAGILLLKKRIKLYLVWFGDRKSKDTNEPVGGMLGKIALRSGGEIIYMDETNDIENSSNDLEDNMITLISDSFRGSQEIDIPIDTTISSIQMKIDSQMRSATLETPTGDSINLKRIMHLKSKKFIGSTKIYYEINLPLEKINNLNHLKLKLIPSVQSSNYCLSIELEKPFKNYDFTNLELVEKFDQTANYINKINIVDKKQQRKGRLENYIFSHENLRFPNDNETKNFKDMDVETIDVNMNRTNEAQQIGGTLTTGSSLFSVTKIDLGISSQLLVYPGMESHIDYEITNLREETVFHTLRVVDTKSYLRTLSPNSVYVRPGETITVRLILLIPQNAKVGTVDDITLTLEGRNQVTQAAKLKVISRDESQDRNPPYVTWTFGNRCENSYYNQIECNSKFWTLDVFAQDYETGILRVSSTPNGIIPKTGFIAGSTEPVRSVYTASCCEPRVTIMAYDVAGNQRTYTIDVRDIVLTEASIAAIVLGVILLILLIGFLIALIVWCCKRRRSKDLSFRIQTERTR